MGFQGINLIQKQKFCQIFLHVRENDLVTFCLGLIPKSLGQEPFVSTETKICDPLTAGAKLPE